MSSRSLTMTILLAACGGSASPPATPVAQPAPTPAPAPAVGSDDDGGGTIGLGDPGTIGHGAGVGAGGAGAVATPTALVAIRRVTPNDKLDAAIVTRYLKRQVAKLNYCFEKELVARPTLKGGDALAAFTVTGEGRTVNVTVANIDPAVAGCITQVIQAIEFPRPKGQVSVSLQATLTYAPH